METGSLELEFVTEGERYRVGIGDGRLRRASFNHAKAVKERPMSFVLVARLEEIPTHRGLHVRVGEVDIGLYRVADRVYAMEDTCPHAGFPLSKGELEGCVVVCQAHGWPFDVRTGFDPENTDGFPIPCFAVSVEDGRVHIDLDRRINDPRRGGGATEGAKTS